MNELLKLVSHPLAARVGVVLLHFVWQGAVLGAFAAVCLLSLRRASAASRYLALLLILAAMALCPLVTFLAVPRAPVATPREAAVTAREWVELQPPVSARGAAPVATRPVASHGSPSPRGVSVPVGAVPRPSWVARTRTWALPRLAWISLLWLAGVIVLSLRFLLRGWTLWRLTRRLQPADPHWQGRLTALSQRLALGCPVKLVVSAAAHVPVVIGWLRPAVVLPVSALTGLAPEQLTALLAHELAHLRRRDHWVGLAQTLIELLLFYHPAVWWVSRALRAEREHCCDDTAVAMSGDLAGYMSALAWVDEHRGDQLQPVLAASGSALLARIRRLASGPTPLEPRGGSLPAFIALAVIGLVLIGGVVAAQSPAGYHPSHHDQWMPQTEHDPRLQQSVYIEIIGRPATAAMKLLSDATGVFLGIAPEDMETVGDRKLTIIAQGCSLKALLVQVPKALQECHVDIDTSAKEPAYLLHRNGDAEITMRQLAEEEMGGYREDNLHSRAEARPFREQEVASARKALAMPPAELAALAGTDPLLAAAVKDPETRAQMQLFLSLPDDAMEEFLASGSVTCSYASAPERFQQVCLSILPTMLDQKTADFAKANPDLVTFTYESHDWDPWGAGLGTMLGVRVTLPDGSPCGIGFNVPPALPPRVPESSSSAWHDRLVKTGVADGKTAAALLADLTRRHDEEGRRDGERRRAAAWREPQSPELHRVITLPFTGPVDAVQVQQYLAKETGLSIISDSFTRGPERIPGEARTALPVWRLLYLLEGSPQNYDAEYFTRAPQLISEEAKAAAPMWQIIGRGSILPLSVPGFWDYEWESAGDCLTLHDRYWYRRAPRELPASLIEQYRAKLRQQGALSLDDVAAIAVELERRRSVHGPRERNALFIVPEDLEKAGLSGPRPFRVPSGYAPLATEARLLYAALTPEQREEARSERGLAYRNMTSRQKELVRRCAAGDRYRPPLAEDQIVNAVYRVLQTGEPTPPSGEGDRLTYELRVSFPGRAITDSVSLKARSRPRRGGP